MLVRKASKPTTSRLIARLVSSSIVKALDEDVCLEGDATSEDTFDIRQWECLVTRFSFGESKRELEGVEMAKAATPSSSLFELLSSCSPLSSEEYLLKNDECFGLVGEVDLGVTELREL
jgi:hypothetical protein